MKKEINTPTWAWDYYQALQVRAFTGSNDYQDEALNFVSQLITSEKIPSSVGEMDRLLDNHLAGYRQKLRRRALLLERMIECDDGEETAQRVDQRERIAAIQALLTAAQWKLLEKLATGCSYDAISHLSRTPIGTLKSIASRARGRLRRSAVFD
jgi:hypothetical protein